MTPQDVEAHLGWDVVIGTPRSMGDGALTVRWGIVREVRDDVVIFDAFHDSAMIGAYVDGSYRHDGVPFPLKDIVTIRRAR